jgi:hypothetical protein
MKSKILITNLRKNNIQLMSLIVECRKQPLNLLHRKLRVHMNFVRFYSIFMHCQLGPLHLSFWFIYPYSLLSNEVGLHLFCFSIMIILDLFWCLVLRVVNLFLALCFLGNIYLCRRKITYELKKKYYWGYNRSIRVSKKTKNMNN